MPILKNRPIPERKDDPMKKTSLPVRIAAMLAMLCCLLAFASCSACAQKDEPKEPSWKNDPEASAFITEIGGCSETYKGSVSEKSYDKAEDAVNDYVVAEVVSAGSECRITETKLEKKLSQKEITDLGISDEMMSGADKVEKYNVAYESTEKDEDSNLMMIDSDSKFATAKVVSGKTVVYIITYKDFFKYFSPVVEDGNTLTKSYYDSIFNSEKYKNCTFEQTVEMTVDCSSQGQTINYSYKMTSLIKFDNGKIYMESKTEGNVPGMPASDSKIYVEDDGNGGINCYVYQNGEWLPGSMSSSGIHSVDDLTPFKNQYLDHSYFSKTDFGCALEKKNYEKYMKTAMSILDFGSFTDNMNIEGYVNYYVSGGVLSGLRSDVNVSFSESGTSFTEKVTTTAKCTNYGTTVVDIPVK